MALPFLKRNKEASSAGTSEPVKFSDSDKEPDHLETSMEELHSALMAKDYKTAADIFRAAFELLDSEPHVEGSHLNKED